MTLLATLRDNARQARHLRHVLPAVVRAVGRGEELAPTGTADAPAALQFPESDRAVVVMVDGLGIENLAARAGHAPFLRRLLSTSERDPATGLPSLSTCAPSTTAAAITSLGTGELPGRTAMVGYEVRDPVRGAPISLIAWEETSLHPHQVQQVPTIAQRLAGAGMASIGPARFAGTGLTEAALRGWPHHSAETLADRVDATIAALRNPEITLSYLYWGEVDHTGHGHGWESERWVQELEHLDAELRNLARRLERLPGTTLMVITADHGMVDVARRHDVTEIDQLGRDVAVIAGDLRAPHLHLNPEPGKPADTEDAAIVAGRWEEYFTELGVPILALTRAQLTHEAYLGPLEPMAQQLIGDVVVFLGGRDVVIDPRSQHGGYRAMPGVHGSLTDPEMRVPLLVAVL